MSPSRSGGSRRLAALIAAGIATTLLATGCSGPQADGKSGSSEQQLAQSDIDAALDQPTELTFWAWGPQYAAVVEAFNKTHPKVKVKLLNEGSGTDQYTKLQNVLKAKSGVPDVAQLEFAVMPQFALGGSLSKLDGPAVSEMKAKFSASSWTASQFNGSLYGLPQDGGPLAMFYRRDVFEKYGLELPKTWDQYLDVARKLRKADPSKYITADSGDPGTANALIWQAGGRPYKTENENVSVDFGDEGTAKWADSWSRLLDEGLVDTATAGFTPEWNAGLANGKYATLITGAWAAGTLQRRIAGGAGKWAVAPVPQYKEGDTATGQTGGSLSAVMDASTKKAAATGFVQWMASAPEAAKIWSDQGGFPCTRSTLTSDAWLNVKVPYFAGQEINKVFADSAEHIGEGWQFLPFQAYANSIFADTVGQAYVKRTDLRTGLKDWQGKITAYGKTQGFKIQE